jgi:hypothetical protein
MAKIRQMCILAGCDYLPSVVGIALKVVFHGCFFSRTLTYKSATDGVAASDRLRRRCQRAMLVII